MSTAEVLCGARKLLVTEGWGQKYYRGGSGCYCVEGAIQKAATGHPHVKTQAAVDAQAALARAIPCKPGHLMPWNDHRLRTQQDVLAAFDRAIAACAAANGHLADAAAAIAGGRR